MTIPSSVDVDLALLVELVRVGRPIKRREAYDLVARHFPRLSAEDRAKTRKNGNTKVFNNIVEWSRNRMRVRGLLADNHPPGVWGINGSAGSALVDDLVSKGLARQAAESFVKGDAGLTDILGMDWARPLRMQADGMEPDIPEAPPEPVQTPAVRGGSINSVDHHDIRDALLSRLNAMSGSDFEQFVGRVLDSLGFRDTQVVGRSGDEGVDVLTYFHSPFLRAKVAVQVKRHTGNVGPRDISYLRDRWARRADRLLFITTSDFTSGAREVAEDSHDRQVDLVSGTRLVDVLVEHRIGVTVRPQVTYEVDDAYFAT
ncbi:MAG: restriction endonuclease [Chloroflexi bacterium]|nr:restriction endonuclease [Chloroflexota bacterium]